MENSVHYFYESWDIEFYGDDILAIEPIGIALIAGDRYTGEWLEIDGLKPGDPGYDERKKYLNGFDSVSCPEKKRV